MKKNSLLAKIYGVFTIKTKYMNEWKEFNVLLMENVAKLRDPSQLTHVFDLKGSLVNRKTTPEIGTLKDQNYIEICEKIKPNPFVQFSEADKQNCLFDIRNDVMFLKS